MAMPRRRSRNRTTADAGLPHRQRYRPLLGGGVAAAVVLLAALGLDALGFSAFGDARQGSGTVILAVNWQPAFCERRRGLSECETQTAERFDATHFALHGLWPQPRDLQYCEVDPALIEIDRDGRWEALPPLDLAPETRAALNEVMPGTASHLHRHEWLKHGTCHVETPEEYFADSLRLLAELNASPVRDLLAGAIGGEVSSAEIQRAADEAFGVGAGARIEIRCRDGLITDLRLHLAGPITPSVRLDTLLLAAAPAPISCASGHVDPVG